jgi:hypothetical protein
MVVSATVCGMDAKGRPFIDRVRVLNLSRDGALLEDVSCAVSVGNLVALRCEGTTRRFRVIWGEFTDDGRRVGLAGFTSATATFGRWLPASGPDDFVRERASARRQQARFACEIAVEIRLSGVAIPMWVTASDLSEGGCRVQVPQAMPAGTEVSIALWIDGERVWMRGLVTHSIYGCGTGIRITKADRIAQERISEVISKNDAGVADRRESSAEPNQLCAAHSATS